MNKRLGMGLYKKDMFFKFYSSSPNVSFLHPFTSFSITILLNNIHEVFEYV